MVTRLVRFFAFLLSSAALCCSLFPASAVAAPAPFITWHASNLHPSDFEGKPFPTRGTTVTASLTAIEAGKFVDLSKDTILWYRNDRQFSYGAGLTTVSFVTTGERNSRDTIRAVVRDGHPFETAEIIPVAAPKLVFQWLREDAVDGPVEVLRAVPFFFNVPAIDGISFSWQLNIPSVPGSKSNERILGNPNREVSGYVLATSQSRIDEYVKRFIPIK